LIGLHFQLPDGWFPMNSSKPETEPARDEVAKKAYSLYLEEGCPQGHDVRNWLEAEAQMAHTGSGHSDHSDHHAHMAADFRKRFCGRGVDVR